VLSADGHPTDSGRMWFPSGLAQEEGQPAMKPRIVMALLCAFAAGCAGPAAISPQPTVVWGFRVSFPEAPSVEAALWGPTIQVCQSFRASEVREASSVGPMEASDCRHMTVNAGGAWWGYTVAAFPGSGRAVNDKDLCNALRKAATSARLSAAR
jgi:hypothetical protein